MAQTAEQKTRIGYFAGPMDILDRYLDYYDATTRFDFAAAKKAKANAVINIASVDQRSLYKDTEKFQCRAGLLIASVALRGDLAQIKE